MRNSPQEDGFLDIPVLPDAIVVNVGDLLQMCTDSTLFSAQHRVVKPKPPLDLQDRYSIAFFLHPADDEIIEPLSIVQTSGRLEEKQRMQKLIQQLKSPFTAREYLLGRLNATF